MVTKLCVFALLVSGCAKTESSDLLTSGIYADLSARATGMGTTTISATLYVDNPNNLNFVELTGNDQLIASYGGQDKVMSQVELGNIVSHSADFSTDAEGTIFTIKLQRSVDAGAPMSMATLPAKFAIGTVPATASRAAPLTLSWSPSAYTDAMAWKATGPCIGEVQGVITGDPGTLTIPAGMIAKAQGQNIPDTCTVTITMTRSRPGVLDTHYGKGGVGVGSQDRTVTMMSMP